MARSKPAKSGSAEGSTYNRKSRRAWQSKKRELAHSDNPERLTEQSDNSLFGSGRSSAKDREGGGEGGGEAKAQAKAQAKRARPQVLKVDPAAEAATQARKKAKLEAKAAAATEGGGRGGGKGGGKGGGRGRGKGKGGRGGGKGGKGAWRAPAPPLKPSDKVDRSKPYAEAVKDTLKAWEKLRADRTSSAERSELIDGVLERLGETVVDVLQKHDAARVLQSCFR